MNSQESYFSTAATEPQHPRLYDLLTRAFSCQRGNIEVSYGELRKVDNEVTAVRVALEDRIRAGKREINELDEALVSLHSVLGLVKADRERLMEQIGTVEAERDRYREALESVFDQGHNEDCIFCGFKDKYAKAALAGAGEDQGE